MANTDFTVSAAVLLWSLVWTYCKKWPSWIHSEEWASPYTLISLHPSYIAVALRTVIGWLTYGPELIGRAWFRVTDAVGRFWVGSSCWPSSESKNQNLSRCTKRYRPDQEGSSPSESSDRPVHQDDRTLLRHHQRSFSFKCEYLYTLSLFKSMHLFIESLECTS